MPDIKNGESVEYFDTVRQCMRRLVLCDGITVETKDGIVVGIGALCIEDYIKYAYLIGKNVK